jgi:lysophospholipase L1-like esterase
MNIWMILSIVLMLVLIVLISLTPFFLRLAKKQAEDAFLKFLLQNGFHHRLEDFKRFNQQAIPGGIVFVGDSITQEFQIHEFFPNQVMYNRGIGGDTTQGLLTRLEESVYGLKPKQVVLQMGTNDFPVLKLSPEQSLKNLQLVVHQLLTAQPTIKIVLVSVYPIHEPTLNFKRKVEEYRTNARLRVINTGLKEIPGVQFVNIFDLLLDAQGQLNMNFSRDGLHLNAKGYEVVASAIAPWIKPVKSTRKD